MWCIILYCFNKNLVIYVTKLNLNVRAPASCCSSTEMLRILIWKGCEVLLPYYYLNYVLWLFFFLFFSIVLLVNGSHGQIKTSWQFVIEVRIFAERKNREGEEVCILVKTKFVRDASVQSHVFCCLSIYKYQQHFWGDHYLCNWNVLHNSLTM